MIGDEERRIADGISFRPYELLSLAPPAKNVKNAVESGYTDVDISKAYRKAALKYHPDRRTANPEMFRQVERANRTLKTMENRIAYEKYGATLEAGTGVKMNAMFIAAPLFAYSFVFSSAMSTVFPIYMSPAVFFLEGLVASAFYNNIDIKAIFQFCGTGHIASVVLFLPVKFVVSKYLL